MFIAHLPAAYLVTPPLLRRAGAPEHLRKRLLLLGLAASVLPDLDLLWFYFVDHRRQVHHAYLPHLPLACVLGLAVVALGLWLGRAGRWAWVGLGVVALNVGVHLLLDTAAGGIRWLWPFSEAELVLGRVEARYHPWYLNFVLHWTFGLEIVLTAAALARLRGRRRRARPAAEAL